MWWVAAAVCLLLVLAAAAPVRVSVRAEVGEDTRLAWRFRWLYGLVDVRSDGRTRKRASSSRVRPLPARPRRRGAGTGNGRAALAALRTRGFLPRVGRLVADVGRQVRIEHFDCHLILGCDDPADTGAAFGLAAPVFAAAAARGWRASCEPDFAGARIGGSASTALRVRPLMVLVQILVFLLSPPVLRAFRAARAR